MNSQKFHLDKKELTKPQYSKLMGKAIKVRNNPNQPLNID
jgi:hypothetical protein